MNTTEVQLDVDLPAVPELAGHEMVKGKVYTRLTRKHTGTSEQEWFGITTPIRIILQNLDNLVSAHLIYIDTDGKPQCVVFK